MRRVQAVLPCQAKDRMRLRDTRKILSPMMMRKEAAQVGEINRDHANGCKRLHRGNEVIPIQAILSLESMAP